MEDKKVYTQEEILSDFKENLKLDIVQEQLEYYWIRVYTSKVYDLTNGTIVNLNHIPTKETFPLIFTNYDKVGKTDYQINKLESYESEDDKKVILLLVNMTELYKNDDIDYIKTLFRQSRFYNETLLKRKDLKLDIEILDDNGKLIENIDIEYYDILF